MVAKKEEKRKEKREKRKKWKKERRKELTNSFSLSYKAKNRIN